MPLRGATIAGVGSYLPERVLTNADLEKMVDTSDEWIVAHTGIRERRIAADDQATSDLAYEAAVRALADAGVAADEVDLIILATFSGDYPVPATANLLQARLGCTKATAFDLVSGCTGFVLGMMTASAYIQSGMVDCVLVIAAETLTRYTDWTDRATCVLFGDGAGAVVMKPCEPGLGLLGHSSLSQGEWGHLLMVPAGGTRRPIDEEALANHDDKVKMEGHDVYKLSVRGVPQIAEQALADAGVEAAEIDWVIIHQANKRIIEAAAERFGWPMTHVPLTIDKYGNSSAATMPITLDELYREGNIKPGDKVLFVGFGAGFALAAAVFRWTKEPPASKE
jgi:3-oxoacyl-[acyl-carrier-protein] synthase-3